MLSGILLILGLITASRGVPAWLAWKRETAASAAELTAEVARAEASVLGLEASLDTLERRKARFLAIAPLLTGVESPAAAAGSLASRVSAAAGDAGIRLGAIQVHTDTAEASAIQRVSVRADGVGDIRGIMALLVALERGPALLAVRELTITQPDPAAPDDQPETLQLELQVEGIAFDRDAKGAR